MTTRDDTTRQLEQTAAEIVHSFVAKSAKPLTPEQLIKLIADVRVSLGLPPRGSSEATAGPAGQREGGGRTGVERPEAEARDAGAPKPAGDKAKGGAKSAAAGRSPAAKSADQNPAAETRDDAQRPEGKRPRGRPRIHFTDDQRRKPRDPEVDGPAVDPAKSVHANYIVCLEDGEKLKMLKRHLFAFYGMTPAQYRQKWKLPADYPMVAPNYAKLRRKIFDEQQRAGAMTPPLTRK